MMTKAKTNVQADRWVRVFPIHKDGEKAMRNSLREKKIINFILRELTLSACVAAE